MSRRSTRSRLSLGLTLAALMLAAPPVVPTAGAADNAADPGARLKEVNRALEEGRRESEASQRKAEALAGEVAGLRRDLIATAATIQTHEAEVAGLEDKLAALTLEEKAKTARLAVGRHQFDQALMALQRIARHPPEALIVQPEDANAIVRSAILLRAAVPEIERRSEALRAELTDIAAVRAAAAQRRVRLASATDKLKTERKRLDDLLGRKATLKQQADAETRAAQQRVEALVRESHDLQDLVTRIEEESRRQQAEREARAAAERLRAEKEQKEQKERQLAARTPATQAPPAPPPSAASGALVPISKARGRLPFPVVGDIVGRYGQTTDAGLTRKGLSIETRPGAQVVTPYDGLVLFAGPFRGYGQILILEHGEGYHTLLAGLSRITAVPGQWLAAGEPVGVMERTDRGDPVLYMELRRNGQPINPLPWLASQKDKVSG